MTFKTCVMFVMMMMGSECEIYGDDVVCCGDSFS